MVNALGQMFQGFNKFCEEKTSKWRQSFSASSPSSPMAPRIPPSSTAGPQAMAPSTMAGGAPLPRGHCSASSSCCSSTAPRCSSSGTTSGVPTSNFVPSPHGSVAGGGGGGMAKEEEEEYGNKQFQYPRLSGSGGGGHHRRNELLLMMANSKSGGNAEELDEAEDGGEGLTRLMGRRQTTTGSRMSGGGGGGCPGAPNIEIGDSGDGVPRRRSAGSTASRRSLEEAALMAARKMTADGAAAGGNLSTVPISGGITRRWWNGQKARGKGKCGMSSAEFRRRGRQMVDYIADYLDGIENRRVVPSIEPGYLRELIPPQAPRQPEAFDRVLQDFEAYIMPGVTHWQHPRFHAYFPAGNSFPSILADMLSDALGCMGFSWAACPAMTELEMHMLQWFGEMIGLPPEFLPFTENGPGGGVIQGSASECNFVALLAARFEVMKELRQRFPFVEEGLLMSKLIAYCSKEAHSSVEKAAMIALVKLRILETDSNFRLRGETLQSAITEDRNLGLIPFFVSTTLGTTSCCSFDVLSEIGPVCSRNDIWLHVDAAYAGSAMVCPEFRYLMAGIEHAMSFNTNPNKWMLVNFDCSTMWVKDRFKLTQALVVDPLYLQHSWTDKAIDYRHWGIPLSRRFRSLKLWFVIRMYGIEGIQRYIREHVRLAKRFESLLLGDEQFEIVGDVIMGLVCFRMKASDELNQLLLTKLNSGGRIHMVPASLNERFVIRFCVCQENATERDILIAYELIKQMALSLYEPIPEPIVENYEMEVEEAKQYDQMMMEKRGGVGAGTPTLRSQKSVSGGGIGAVTAGNASTESNGASSHPPPPLPPLASAPSPPPPVPPFGSSDSHHQLPPASVSSSTSLPTPPPVALHDRRRLHTLAEKRSFLVRMVSDPKCYNPKIVRHLNMRTHNQTSQDLFRDRSLRQAIEQGSRGSAAGLVMPQQPPTVGHHNPFSKAAQFGSGKYSYMSIDQGSDDE